MSDPAAADAPPALSPEVVLSTAATIADTEGIDAVTLTRVAADLAATQPALYRHIESYDHLIRALSLRGRELLADRLLRSIAGVSGDAAVRSAGHAWRQMVLDHPGLYAATDRYPVQGDRELEEAVRRVVDVLSLALGGYDLDPAIRVDAARALRSAFHGFSHLEIGDGHPMDQDLEASFEQMLALLCRGIRSMD